MNSTEYQKRIAERDSQETPEDNDSSSHQSDNSIFLDVVGGVNKKGRVYGIGSEAGKYKSSTFASSSYSVSAPEYEQMRVLVSTLTAENKSLQDRLQTHEERFHSNEELIRSSQEESRRLRDQLFRFMNSFSLGHSSALPSRPDPHEPPSVDQDNDEADHGFDDELGGDV
ncbi:putative transposase, Ptta/En/Spm, plant [Sesbania bispinosa]|nr:putative transposase, Ptta/En/Spm, plant [Sesbania bispinosa]